MHTALSDLARLEALGWWSPDPGTPAREVVVQFGAHSLTLTDTAERPLTHWSLAALTERPIPGEDGARAYSPDAFEGERLTIRDAQMIAAIDRVRRAHAPRGGGRGPGLALLAVLAMGLVGIAAATGAGPWALGRALDLAPGRLSAAIATPLGAPACNARGQRILARLAGRAGVAGIVPVQGDGLRALPDGQVAMGRQVIASDLSADALAGLALMAAAAPPPGAAEIAVHAGWTATARAAAGAALTPGEARAYLDAAPPSPPPATLLPAFAEAGLSPADWLRMQGEASGPAPRAARPAIQPERRERLRQSCQPDR
ncbi:MAG: hypothetical protein ACU0BF_06320 [Paracoccaceae bacterium]